MYWFLNGKFFHKMVKHSAFSDVIWIWICTFHVQMNWASEIRSWRKNPLLVLAFTSFTVTCSYSQHDMHSMHMDNDSGAINHFMQHTSFFSPNLPMSRDGSGTSWLPMKVLHGCT
jgi:hypothetical protein